MKVSPQSDRFESLDPLRGFACLLVVFYHATYFYRHPVKSAVGQPSEVLWLFQLFWIGVPVFFVVSGYCISASALRVFRMSGGIHQYFLRRLRRIYPPYLLCLTATAMLTVIVSTWLPSLLPREMFPVPADLAAANWVGNLTLTETWLPGLFGGAPSAIVPVAWTLCYEEQFYILCGICLVGGRRGFWLGIVIVSLWVFSNCVSLNVRPVRALGWDLNAFDLKAPGTFLAGNWLDFAVGCNLYFRINGPSHLRKYADLVLVLATLLIATQYDQLTISPGFHSFRFVAIATGWCCLVLYRFDGRISRSSRVNALRGCGAICYSLYLCHFPIVLLVSGSLQLFGWSGEWSTLLVVVPLCLLASVAVSLLFFDYCEYPFLSDRQKDAASIALAADSWMGLLARRLCRASRRGELSHLELAK